MNQLELLDLAKRSFTELPPEQRQSPARTRNLQARFYIDRYQEHQQAFDFLANFKQTRGEGPKTLVRALLFYRQQVIEPLEALGPDDQIPKELVPWLLDFTANPKSRNDRTKAVSIRLHIDKIVEHRQVYEFLQEQQRLHGDGNKTIIRALLNYQRNVFQPLVAKGLG